MSVATRPHVFYTIGELARRFGCREWQVRRLYERRLLPPAQRVGQYRVVPVEALPEIERALREAGYIPAGGEGGES